MTDAKGERFVHRSTSLGARTEALLPEILIEAIAAMPIPKPMRWGDRDAAFARPVHWLTMLLGNDVVAAECFGISAGRDSRGHRFMQDGPLSIPRPDDYIAVLRDAHVLVDPDERRERIVQQAHQAAARVAGDARITGDNLEQVNCLVEWPCAVLCGFEPEFLTVPQEALIETMEVNQKFFPVLNRNGRLTEHFIGIANIESKNPDELRKGYERVIRPRFSDAQFFFAEDLKQGLPAMGDGLKNVTYHAKLGTIWEKVQRLGELAEAIAEDVGGDRALARRAAELSKNDLQSRMVNEFPELQGIAGRHYASAAGEPDEVALAIDEAYQPRFAGDDIALSPLGKILAIAERLDTLVGGFIAGLKPTGNKDPFALRRNALGLARTLIESDIELPLLEYLTLGSSLIIAAKSNVALTSVRESIYAARSAGLTLDLAASQDRIREFVKRTALENFDEDAVFELYDFILERLRGYYADQGVPAAHFNAVAERRPVSLTDFDRRLAAIGEFAALPEAEALAAANKRIRNILRKAEETIPPTIDPALLKEPAECELAEAVEAALAETGQALLRRDYISVLGRLARLRPPLDAFFDKVLVNAEDPAVRGNRLALLHRLSTQLGSVAAIDLLFS
jgi:glycyl-tRNA synthetase beta chain